MTAKRVTFNRGDLSSAIEAARRLKSDKDLFVVPTAYGLSIEKVKPPVWLKHIIVKPDGTVEEIGMEERGNPNPINDNFAIQEVMELNLPEPIKQEWLAELESGSAPKINKIKRLSNENGRSAILVLWADEHMTAIITDNAGIPFISETSKRDPEAFYLAAAFLEAEGLMVIE